MYEKEHVLSVLEKTKEAFENQDSSRLYDLSNQTIHSASIQQEKEQILIAVIIYSLSKIISRENYKDSPQWNSFYKTIAKFLNQSINFLKKDEEENFKQSLIRIRKQVSLLTGDFKKSIQDVFLKASINKASKIYEHGISMEKTAKLLGINLWELADYAGQSNTSDMNLTITIPVKKRIKTTMDFFK